MMQVNRKILLQYTVFREDICIMALPRQKMRELTFETLYSFQFDSGTEKELVAFLMQEHKVTKKNATEAYLQAKNIEAHQEELDAMITKISSSYDIERIGSCERTILRLALWELFLEKTIPAPCIISEAKRIARKFAGLEAASFLHGLLDAALRLRG